MRRSRVIGVIVGGAVGASLLLGGVVALAAPQDSPPIEARPGAAETSTPRVESDGSRAARLDAATATPTQSGSAPSPSPAEAPPAEPSLAEGSAEAEPVPAPEPELEPAPNPAPASDPAPAPDSDWGAGFVWGSGAYTPEQEQWLFFQEVVRDCMADAGKEYLYWEWWNNAAGAGSAMPGHLVGEERATWELALHGDTPLGAEYDWTRAGCWGYAAQFYGTGN